MHERQSAQIARVMSASDLADAARLFRDYASSLDVDLAYQDFEAELAGLPGRYAPDAGCLLLARRPDGVAVGCVALRPILPSGSCEMKRLYVAPEGRGVGLGARLVEAIVLEAERIGYREIRLDTLPSMTSAIALYRKLGFGAAAPHCDSPVAGTHFMRRAIGCPTAGERAAGMRSVDAPCAATPPR